MLIDTHAHMNDKRLIDDADNIVSNMLNDNLSKIINVGYDRESSNTAFELAKKYDNLYCAVGIHPHDAKLATTSDYYLFESLYKDEKTVAIGEIGLDYYYDLSPREVQKRVFVEQLELAHSLQAPVVIHLRDAYQDMYDLLKENNSLLTYGILVHCYSGSKEMMARYNEFNPYYSFGGAVTFKNATEKPNIIRSMDVNKLLLETDCPYMTPVPFRGTTNYPRYVNLVAERIADILSVTKEEIEEITTSNAYAFFNKLK